MSESLKPENRAENDCSCHPATGYLCVRCEVATINAASMVHGASLQLASLADQEGGFTEEDELRLRVLLAARVAELRQLCAGRPPETAPTRDDGASAGAEPRAIPADAERWLNDGASLLAEEAETVASCMHCDRRAAWKSDERKFVMHNTAGHLRSIALRIAELRSAQRDAKESIARPPETAGAPTGACYGCGCEKDELASVAGTSPDSPTDAVTDAEDRELELAINAVTSAACLVGIGADGWTEQAKKDSQRDLDQARSALVRLIKRRTSTGYVEDSARLDWMEQNTKPHKHGGMFVAVTEGLWEVGETMSAGFNGCSEGEGPTLRAAIDNARGA